MHNRSHSFPLSTPHSSTALPLLRRHHKPIIRSLPRLRPNRHAPNRPLKHISPPPYNQFACTPRRTPPPIPNTSTSISRIYKAAKPLITRPPLHQHIPPTLKHMPLPRQRQDPADGISTGVSKDIRECHWFVWCEPSVRRKVLVAVSGECGVELRERRQVCVWAFWGEAEFVFAGEEGWWWW